MAGQEVRAAAEEALGRIVARRGGWACVACGHTGCKFFAEFGSVVNGGARRQPLLDTAFQTVMLICENCGFVHHHRLDDLGR